MAAQIGGHSRGSIVVRPELQINGIKVFSATMYQQRALLGETVTAWITAHRELTIVDITVVQSSDAEFHCVTIVVGYHEPRAAR
jgi:hypothetical protein